MEIYLGAIIILAVMAVAALIVGVSNDAVNFLNSSIGSRVAPRYIILSIASLGMMLGVTFSRGMMEVARTGIFHPELFTMPEVMVVFLAVMLTNVLLLDIYNTYGLPTSTTVAIVFGLLGAAVAVSSIKIIQDNGDLGSLVDYINTAKALAIISGILMSVMMAFLCGMIIQFFSRLLFTFDFHKRLRRYGAIWGGLGLSGIIYFILIKGAKGSTFITPGALKWIQGHTGLILLAGFFVCAFILQLFIWLTRVNILKPIVLIGTFALAMAFAANDLVNFIGVPLAGLNVFKIAKESALGLDTLMTALKGGAPSDTLFMMAAGIIMAVTLWISRKTRTVSATELNLGRQDEGVERFGSSPLARTVVRMATSMGGGLRAVIPAPVLEKVNTRFDTTKNNSRAFIEADKPSFDLVRAAVNLIVASALISLGTSLKLPLSTTYVTFMVSMGSSFSDRAWGRDSAVYRVTGVLTVIGGWFLTAFMTFTVSFIFALVIFYGRVPGLSAIIAIGIVIFVSNHRVHKKRARVAEDLEIFNLRKLKDGKYAISTTFEHVGIFLKEVAGVLAGSYEGIAGEKRLLLKNTRNEAKRIRTWANIIVANVFKTLRLLQKEVPGYTQKYAEAVNVLQEIAECQRDVTRRTYDHVDNNHKPLLPVQLEELAQVKDLCMKILLETADAMMKKDIANCKTIEAHRSELKRLQKKFDKNQVDRIQDETSKTRLSILFYGFIRDSRLIADHTVALLKIFEGSFSLDRKNSKPAATKKQVQN